MKTKKLSSLFYTNQRVQCFPATHAYKNIQSKILPGSSVFKVAKIGIEVMTILLQASFII